MNQPRIILADAHPNILEALRYLLRDLGEVVETVTDGLSLVDVARRLHPDVIITDISMPGLNGLDATRALRDCTPASKVIILTLYRSSAYVSLAFDAGASGYVLKRCAVAELPQAVLHVLAGESYVGQGVGMQETEAEPVVKSL